jgi:CxxC-x17-CxxC domain-containing protein
LEDAGNEVKIINSSRERYSSAKVEVEDKIRRWSGMLTPAERQAIVSDQNIAVSRSATPMVAPSRVAPSAPLRPNVTFQKTVEKSPRGAENIQRSEENLPTAQANHQSTVERREQKINTEVSLAPASEAMPEKILYSATCSGCGIDIQIPFVPDGKRPTFCKDCLRDYQRSVAKARNEAVAQQRPVATSMPSHTIPLNHARTMDRTTESKAYVSSDAPMSLSNMQYVGPKKFKPMSQRPLVNLKEVRELLNHVQRKDGK